MRKYLDLVYSPRPSFNILMCLAIFAVFKFAEYSAQDAFVSVTSIALIHSMVFFPIKSDSSKDDPMSFWHFINPIAIGLMLLSLVGHFLVDGFCKLCDLIDKTLE